MEYPYQQYMYSYPHKTAYGPLEDIHLKDYIHRLAGKESSLYFHIPFCQYKCGYCNLFSEAGSSERRMADYIDALERHAEQIAGILPLQTTFSDLTLGGGTPLLLPESQLSRVFSLAKEVLGFQSQGHSIAVETSPNQTTRNKLSLLKEEGVTRISIGVQSFQEEELLTLHRLHRAETAHMALAAIRENEFACMNIDIIYGIPGQTADSLTDSLRQALSYQPEELFVYPLYIKPETFLSRQGASPSPTAFSLYQCARDFLQGEGYQPYSMRRFVKGGHRNYHYTSCGFGSTLSVGCGGRSYLGNLHFCAPYAVRQEHCRNILTTYMEQEDYLRISHGYLLSQEEMKRRYVIRHLLFGRGIHRLEYREHFGGKPEEDFPILEEWAASGYVSLGKEFVGMTENGFALSDYLGPKLQ